MLGSSTAFVRDFQYNLDIIRNNLRCPRGRHISGTIYSEGNVINDTKNHKVKKKTTTEELSIIQETLKDIKLKETTRTFINKLKRARMNSQRMEKNPQETKIVSKLTDKFDHLRESTQNRGIKGFQVSKTVALGIIILTFLAALSMQLLSSFHFLLPHFRAVQTYKPWPIVLEKVCLGIMILKIISSFMRQREVLGYRIIKLDQIILDYGLSHQFVLDAFFLASIILILTRREETFPGGIAYIASLARLAGLSRIDELISEYLIFGNTKRQLIALLRLIFTNFFMAHLVGTLFLGVAEIQAGDNWMHKYGVEDATWQEQYIYSVYWAVAITTTVGFGDIVVSNEGQALLVVFVMIFGCLILSYNISQVASIFENLQKRGEDLRKDLRTLQQIAVHSKISHELHRAIADYVVYASEAQFQQDLQNSKQFIDRLPAMLKNKYLDQSNSLFFMKMPMLALLHRATKLKLSQVMTHELMSPEQHITHRTFGIEKIYMLKMGTVGMAYYKEGAAINGVVLDSVVINDICKEHPVLLNSFLLNRSRSLNFWLICQDFCNVASIDFNVFAQCLRETDAADYEFFRFYYDSEAALDEEWAYKKCQECQQNHSIFTCPKLLYMPYRSFIFFRHILENPYQSQMQQRVTRPLEGRQLYKDFVKRSKTHKTRKQTLTLWANTFVPIHQVLGICTSKNYFSVPKSSKTPIEYPQEHPGMIYRQSQFQVDVPHNFSNYFKIMNPENLVEKSLNKLKNRIY